MEISSLFLYVAQPNDTLETIAERFNTSIEEIIRFNPTLQSKNLHSGQPLNIKIIDEEIRIQNNIKRPGAQEFSLITTLIKIAFYIKENIISSVICPDNIITTQQYLDDLYQSILSNHYKINNPEALYEHKQKIWSIVNQIIEFSNVINTKNTENIKKYKCKQDELILSLQYLFDDEISHITSSNFKNILELWNLYTLKYISGRYEEAQLIFLRIIWEFEELSQLL